MGVQNKNTTNYQHPNEPNLLDLHNVMQYSTAGEPVLRTHVDGITLEGNVIVDKVRVEVDPLHNTIGPNNPVPISGNGDVNASSNPIYVNIGNNGTVTLGSGTNYVGRVRLTDGTNNISFDQPNNDGEPTNVYSVPVENYNMVFNGSTWDRLRGDTTSGAWVNIKNSSIAVTQSTNPWIVKQGTDPWTVALSTDTLTALETIQIGNWPSSFEISNDAGNSIPVSGKVAIVDRYGDWNAPDKPVYVEGDMTATITGTVSTIPDGASSVSAFGEPYGITITPVIQVDSIYGITDEVIQTYTNGAGSVAEANPSNALFSVQSGTTAYGYGVLRSRRFLRYRPGQGALARFTAAFTPNVSLNTQRAGLFNQENAIMIGWNDDGVHGPRFGILRSTGARTHITVLTINTAPTGSQTATITLNGVEFNISIAAGTTQATAVSINHTDGFTGWLTDQVDNTIVFMSTSVGPKNGTYSFSSSGTGTLATGTFSTKQTGVDPTNNWTYQSEFNVDRLDGTKGGPSDVGKNPSGMTLRSEHLNVYQINFRWLGVGEIRFAIEDELTGAVVFFHRIHYTNQYNLPHVTQPSFKIGYVSSNMGGTTNATVTGVCMMGAIEGDIRQNELNRSVESVKANLAKDVLYHLVTIRNPYVTNGTAGALNGNYVLNAKEIILKDISIALQGQDPGMVYIFYNATSFSGTHSFYSQPKDNGMISTVDGTLNETIDTAVCRFVTAINGESQYRLSDFRIAIPPGDSVSIGIRSTNGITRVSLALVFSED